MRALAIDVGTGTQDVLLFDDAWEIENCLRLVMPSPTVLIAARIRAATATRRAIVLTGDTMGGGPSAWAARDHAQAGLPVAATPEAARTFDDDLTVVEALGVRIVEPPEAEHLLAHGAVHLGLRDVWLDELADAMARFDVDVRTVDAVAVAVFDHGAAPSGVSDRRFRFERLRERLTAEPEAGPAAFAYRAEAIPPAFTRLAAAAGQARAWFMRVGATSGADIPVLTMDTGPAAVLGALEDVAARRALAAGRAVVAVNVGNFHTLAMHVVPAPPGGTATIAPGPGMPFRVAGIVEHHTGELRRPLLARYLRELSAGTVRDEDVFASMGHGALVLPEVAARAAPPARGRPRATRGARPLLTVTGPRRELLRGSVVRGLGRPYPAVPHGDMMQAGTFGLLRALAYRLPEWRAPVAARLGDWG